MFNSVSRLDPNNPVDKVVLDLIKREIISVHFDKESDQLMVSLTDYGTELANEIKNAGFVPKPSQELTAEDKLVIKKFIQKAEKDLDTFV